MLGSSRYIFLFCEICMAAGKEKEERGKKNRNTRVGSFSLFCVLALYRVSGLMRELCKCIIESLELWSWKIFVFAVGWIFLCCFDGPYEDFFFLHGLVFFLEFFYHMSNHRARTWDHREIKPFDPKFLSLDHHLDDLFLVILATHKVSVKELKIKL